MKLKDIVIRDPYILTNLADHTYYLYGTTPCFDGRGFYCYSSKDLINFEGPFKVFTPPKDFWGTKQFWAPEVYCIESKYFLLATFKADGHTRGCQMLISDSPKGPFKVYSDILTPPEYEALDATLCFDKDGSPYIIFCHEWLQTDIGEMCRQNISKDFKHRVGDPTFLFKGNEAKWASTDVWFCPRKVCITDGPFIYEDGNNKVLLWSSYVNKEDYGIGYAIFDKDNNIIGQSKEVLPIEDSGHCMVFTSFEGQNYITMHTNNKKEGFETACILPISFSANGEVKINE